MMNLADLFRSGEASAWLFIPSAVMLGALHGLEPGHSKTMMTAFIVAIRGTVTQAVLLGLATTVSHTAIVWVVALTGLYFGSQWYTEATEPLLEVASGVLILAVACWMMWNVWAGRRRRLHPHDHRRHHDGDDGHAHEAPAQREDTVLAPSVGLDAHEREHAEDLRRHFAHRHVTTGQIVTFGLTGGLVPCPASITVLLLCLQLKEILLGAALVLCFSIGLALTMIAVGAAAALGVRHLSARWSGLEEFAARAPYVSGALISIVGVYTLLVGLTSMG
ncbi:MAG: nickel/cobalt efflux transporter RcnA [Methylocystis sp.]|nr:nickel/cobalt efflux transporter RcnA [Methylocystis sp.]